MSARDADRSRREYDRADQQLPGRVLAVRGLQPPDRRCGRGRERVARQAMARKVGARGLRMILEDLMLDLMYNLPAQRRVRDFVVTADMVRGREINWSLLEKAG